jgi:hypothetical protein
LEGRKKRRKSDKKIPRFEDIFAKKAANPWFAVLGLEFPRDATQAVTKSDSVSDLGISSLETCGEKIWGCLLPRMPRMASRVTGA